MTEREQLANYKVDRTGWDAGPWDNEPDRLQWQHAGYACLMVRHPRHGYWCAYVGVDRAHPLYGKHPLHGEAPELFAQLDTARDLNYGDKCDDVICHVPEPGMPDDVWWLGMEFGHTFDRAPGMEARERELDRHIPHMAELSARQAEFYQKHPTFRPIYCDQAAVHKATESLAEQLRARVPQSKGDGR